MSQANFKAVMSPPHIRKTEDVLSGESQPMGVLSLMSVLLPRFPHYSFVYFMWVWRVEGMCRCARSSPCEGVLVLGFGIVGPCRCG